MSRSQVRAALAASYAPARPGPRPRTPLARLGTSKGRFVDTTGLSHVILTVPDAERSRAFYADVLGFDTTVIEPGPKGRFFFRTGGVGVFFYTHDRTQPDDRFSEFRVGLDHLAFAAPTLEALEALAARLLAAGVETEGVQRWGQREIPYVSFRDPDNIQLEYWLAPA